MNKRNLHAWTLGLFVAGPLWVGGCKDDSPPGTQIPDLFDEAGAPWLATPPPEEATPETTAEAIPAAPAGKVEPALPEATRPLPPGLQPSAHLAEIIKLAHAGVDESVMLSFVTNSPGRFGLGSEEIIYLNDLGVSGTVITAMIQRDRVLSDLTGRATREGAPQAALTADTAFAPPVATEPVPSAAAVTETVPIVPGEYNAQPVSEVPSAPPVPYAPIEGGTAAAAYAPVAGYAPSAAVSASYFYDSLAPYGSWIDIDGYGLCWQPSVVVLHAGWRPYCDRGRWIYTDCGWYWLSDYSWGSTVFHYGRWFWHHRWGWCWYPGTVWSPAWVSWRYTDAYCGWAPLPPSAYYRPGFGFSYYSGSVGVSFDFGLTPDCYTFIPFNRFCDYRPYRYALPHYRVTKIFNNTTIINNIVTGDGNTVINKGIDPQRVAEVTRAEVRKVSVRDLPTKGIEPRPDRLERHGNSLVVYRPKPLPPLPQKSEPTLPPAPAELTTGGRPAPKAVTVEAGPGATTSRDQPASGLKVRPTLQTYAQPSPETPAMPTAPVAAKTDPPLPRPMLTTVDDGERKGGVRVQRPAPIIFKGEERQPAEAPIASVPDTPVRPTERGLETKARPGVAAGPSPVVIRPQERSAVEASPPPAAIPTEPTLPQPVRETPPRSSIIVIGRPGQTGPHFNRFSVPGQSSTRTEHATPAPPAQPEPPKSHPFGSSLSKTPRPASSYRTHSLPTVSTPVPEARPSTPTPTIVIPSRPEPARVERPETRVFRHEVPRVAPRPDTSIRSRSTVPSPAPVAPRISVPAPAPAREAAPAPVRSVPAPRAEFKPAPIVPSPQPLRAAPPTPAASRGRVIEPRPVEAAPSAPPAAAPAPQDLSRGQALPTRAKGRLQEP